MRRLLILTVAALMLAACNGKEAQVFCPSSTEHDQAFWAAFSVEVEKFMATSPHVMVVLKEADVTQAAVRKCLAAQKKRAKKK
jgi:hypothetical protein